MFKKFCSYYKPHMKLFILDMFCALLVAICNLVYPTLTRSIINDFVPNKNLQALIIAAVALLAIYILKCILNFIIQYWGHMVGVYIQGDMRKELFAHLEKLPFSYFDENKTGTIMSRLINDLMDIAELAHHGPEDIFLSLITLIGSGVLMAISIDPWLTLIIFAIIPFVVVYAMFRRKKMRSAFKQMREETGKINSQVESSVSGIRVAKAYTASDHEIGLFEKRNEEFKTARGKAYKEMGLFGSGMQFFMDFLYLVALVAGGLFYFYERINIGDFTAYILYVTMIISPIRTLVAIYEQIQNGMTGFSRFQEIINTPAEAEIEDAIEIKEFNKNIKFNNVDFKYDVKTSEYKNFDPEKLVLSNISFEIEKGKTVALVGPSGGGKTTICHLIPRFYEVLNGSITIDDVDIKNLTRSSLRKLIGMVAQDVFLFGGTIKDNIAYGNFEATDDEIIEACKKANIHEFIMSLEDGYDTYVGERGVKLSGGQKQRISIARAFLKNPPILILDEATSALDNMTEMQIQAALEKLSVGRTTIVVAHRLSTVKNADIIMVINHEGIIEKGNHEELIKQNGIYANLYQYQFKE
ncbi:MAG: ABC transporter ATP-binding protein [Bacilli bacterium]|nr:ABC transporter ATP-binding protein [Bacilli bacterium]